VTYNTPGTYSLSDEFGESVTVTVNSAQQPLSVIITDPTNNADGLSLHATTTFGPGASWNPVNLLPALLGNQWVVTNPISGPGQFFRLSGQQTAAYFLQFTHSGFPLGFLSGFGPRLSDFKIRLNPHPKAMGGRNPTRTFLTHQLTTH